MGMFDAVEVACPMCGDRGEIQCKPPIVDGECGRWDITQAPQKVLNDASYMPETCGCGCVYEIVRDVNDAFLLRVSKDIPISELPVRVEFTIKKVE